MDSLFSIVEFHPSLSLPFALVLPVYTSSEVLAYFSSEQEKDHKHFAHVYVEEESHIDKIKKFAFCIDWRSKPNDLIKCDGDGEGKRPHHLFLICPSSQNQNQNIRWKEHHYQEEEEEKKGVLRICPWFQVSPSVLDHLEEGYHCLVIDELSTCLNSLSSKQMIIPLIIKWSSFPSKKIIIFESSPSSISFSWFTWIQCQIPSLRIQWMTTPGDKLKSYLFNSQIIQSIVWDQTLAKLKNPISFSTTNEKTLFHSLEKIALCKKKCVLLLDKECAEEFVFVFKRICSLISIEGLRWDTSFEVWTLSLKQNDIPFENCLESIPSSSPCIFVSNQKCFIEKVQLYFSFFMSNVSPLLLTIEKQDTHFDSKF